MKRSQNGVFSRCLKLNKIQNLPTRLVGFLKSTLCGFYPLLRHRKAMRHFSQFLLPPYQREKATMTSVSSSAPPSGLGCNYNFNKVMPKVTSSVILNKTNNKCDYITLYVLHLFSALLRSEDLIPQLLINDCYLEVWTLLKFEMGKSDFTQALTFGCDI